MPELTLITHQQANQPALTKRKGWIEIPLVRRDHIHTSTITTAFAKNYRHSSDDGTPREPQVILSVSPGRHNLELLELPSLIHNPTALIF